MDKQVSFNERCYQLLNLIPEGRVTTYKAVADALGTRAWRAVGSAMANNKHLVDVPCHRVIRSDGKVGEYVLGVEQKVFLLRSEGIGIVNGQVINLSQVLYEFKQ